MNSELALYSHCVIRLTYKAVCGIGGQKEYCLLFLEVDPACNKLVVLREMCLRELTMTMLPEAFLAGRHVEPVLCGLCPGSLSE